MHLRHFLTYWLSVALSLRLSVFMSFDRLMMKELKLTADSVADMAVMVNPLPTTGTL